MKPSIAANSLNNWLEVRGVKKGFFADKIGVEKATLSRWLSGKAMPTRIARNHIHYATDGAVSPDDWMRGGQ